MAEREEVSESDQETRETADEDGDEGPKADSDNGCGVARWLFKDDAGNSDSDDGCGVLRWFFKEDTATTALPDLDSPATADTQSPPSAVKSARTARGARCCDCCCVSAQAVHEQQDEIHDESGAPSVSGDEHGCCQTDMFEEQDEELSDGRDFGIMHPFFFGSSVICHDTGICGDADAREIGTKLSL
eukprot:TRINITY_DN21190_c0_g1_i2.p1 TRINITY_DN21190_c0_g1~~TRINITY_DN21190_c0_g1_i2.p1  ORF type:complete len:187 (-),score=27.88 TRINITY_DN21190_c0_g1_i2:414-974(-)